ncbi:MAG TPA: hypothetical protein PKU89_01980, partial [Kiritimatiellia bacterium]|nr:hypothetical protein [Kiritimatiellia bacterium]
FSRRRRRLNELDHRLRSQIPVVQLVQTPPPAAVAAVSVPQETPSPVRVVTEPVGGDREPARAKPTAGASAPRPVAARVVRPAPRPVPPPPKPVPVPAPARVPRVPIRTRLAAAGTALHRKFAAIPWQVWRTLFGVMVLAVLWIWMARACEQSRKRAPAAAHPHVPLVDPCHPAPEPYLD